MSRYRGPSLPARHLGPETSPTERAAILAQHERLQAENANAAAARRELAAPLVAALAELPPETLAMVGRALELQGGPLATIGRALLVLASGQAETATTVLAGALLQVADDDDLYERLSGAREPPWPAITAAAREIRR